MVVLLVTALRNSGVITLFSLAAAVTIETRTKPAGADISMATPPRERADRLGRFAALQQ
jgi:hypothetical protein